MTRTGQKVTITVLDNKRLTRTFFAGNTYKRAVQWAEEQIEIAEAQGLRPHVRILEVRI